MNVLALNVFFAVNGNQGIYKCSKKRIDIQWAYCPIDSFFSTYVLQFCKNHQHLIYDYGNLVPTYPSPKLTLIVISHLGQNDGLGKG